MASDRFRSRNGYKKQLWSEYYEKNRAIILQKKKQYNKLPNVKQRSAEYHRQYYLIHKEELNRKHSHDRSCRDDKRF